MTKFDKDHKTCHCEEVRRSKLVANASRIETITVIVDGEDEAEAATAIGQFFTEQLKDL